MDLYINTLGAFDIKLGDESMVDYFGRSYRLNKLLHYFLTLRNKKLLPESILENVWPDCDSYDPKNMLRGQIFRLRQILKQIIPEDTDEREYITINFSNGYYTLESGKRVTFDIDIFEGLIRQGDIVKEKDINQAIEMYKNAIKLYAGNYLEEGPYEIWLVPTRNYYNRIYVKTFFNLLELLKEKEKYEEIIELCEKATIHINEEEGVHLYLMEAMLKLGQIKNALSHYEFALPLFSNEIGNVVSPGMKNIYRKIQSHFNENNKIDIREIEAKLEEEVEEGPLFCHMDYFKFIFSSRRRMRHHKEEKDYICLIDLEGKSYNKEEISKWFTIVKDILDNGLRMGDIYTFWNDTQALILLNNVRDGGVEIIE